MVKKKTFAEQAKIRAAKKKLPAKKKTFAEQAKIRAAKKKKKLVTSVPDKIGDDTYGIVKGFLGVNAGKSTVKKRKQILISKLDRLNLPDMKDWLSKHYPKVLKKLNNKRDTVAEQHRLIFEFIMKTPISSTAIDDMPKPKAMELAALNAFRAKSKRKLDPWKEMPGPSYRW